MPEQLEPCLSVEGLGAGYGSLQVLWDFNLEIAAQESVVVLGPNGAGKSTLLKTLLGLLPARTGSISFFGRRIEGLRTSRRVRAGIAYMSEVGIFPELSVQENLLMGGYSLPRHRVRRRIEELCELFPEVARTRRGPAWKLSGGQRKMVGVAKALVAEPRLLVLDEPSAGLSPVYVSSVVEALARTRSQAGPALLVVEQNMKFLALAQRVYVIEGGRRRFQGTVAELEADDSLRRAYFGLQGA
ncbi:MAG TPA: ATP-binding cassette domain-containing protein [Candidatus Saccharimonadales bacterium]|nr:ATP-binding cassette domain-containing protein [Candidatus Saccharimonadales bacterium]